MTGVTAFAAGDDGAAENDGGGVGVGVGSAEAAAIDNDISSDNSNKDFGLFTTDKLTDEFNSFVASIFSI